MDITCGSCRRSYFVPDDLVHGRSVRAKCTHCGETFSIDGSDIAPPGPAEATGEPLSGSDPAIPGLAEVLFDRGSVDPVPAAPGDAAEGEPIVVTARRSSRAGRLAVIGGVAALAAVAGVALWMVGRPRPSDAKGRPRVVTASEGVAAPVEDVGGLAVAPTPTATPTADPPSTATAPPIATAAPAPTEAPSAPADPPPIAIAAAAPTAATDPPPTATEPTAPAPAPSPRENAAPSSRRHKAKRLPASDRRTTDLAGRKRDAPAARAARGLDEKDAPARLSGALDNAAAEKVLTRNRRAFDACVARALRLQPNASFARRATLVLTVEPDGKVKEASVVGGGLSGSDLGVCLADAARRMVFPSFDGDALEMAVPLSLSIAR